jgi:hypothetical protein
MGIRIAVMALYVGVYQSAKPWAGSWHLAWQALALWGVWWIWGAAFDSVWPLHKPILPGTVIDTCVLGVIGTVLRACVLLASAYIAVAYDELPGRAAILFMFATLCSGIRQIEFIDPIPSVIIRTTVFCITHALTALVLDNTDSGRDGSGVRVALATSHILFGSDTISVVTGTAQMIYMGILFSKIFDVPSAKRMNEEMVDCEMMPVVLNETTQKNDSSANEIGTTAGVDMTRLLSLSANTNAV